MEDSKEKGNDVGQRPSGFLNSLGLQQRVEKSQAAMMSVSQLFLQTPMDEWALDIPTIGNAYARDAKVLYYFSGLGLPYSAPDDSDEQNWINRARTLQETKDNDHALIGGLGATTFPPNVRPTLSPTPGFSADEFLTRAVQVKVSLTCEPKSIFPILAAMQPRHAESTFDKIAALAHLLSAKARPIYTTARSEEQAWDSLVDTAHKAYRGDLFFLHHQAGSGERSWHPSWRQVMEQPLPAVDGQFLKENVVRSPSGQYHYEGFHIHNCALTGFNPGTTEKGMNRRGSIGVAAGSRQTGFKFTIEATHSHPIKSGHYTLMGSKDYTYWVVAAEMTEKKKLGHLKKVSVLKISDDLKAERDALAKSGICHRQKSILE